MPIEAKESKSLTAERTRKEKALASLRELQLHELQGKLVRADQVEATWAKAMLMVRTGVLRIPTRRAHRSPIRNTRRELLGPTRKGAILAGRGRPQ